MQRQALGKTVWTDAEYIHYAAGRITSIDVLQAVHTLGTTTLRDAASRGATGPDSAATGTPVRGRRRIAGMLYGTVVPEAPWVGPEYAPLQPDTWAFSLPALL